VSLLWSGHISCSLQCVGLRKCILAILCTVFISATCIHHGPAGAVGGNECICARFQASVMAELRCSLFWMLRSVGWQLVTNILGQPIIPYSLVQSSPKETSSSYFCFVFHLHILIYRKSCSKYLFLFMSTCVKGLKIVSLENV